MCLGGISRIDEAWVDDGVRLGKLADGSVVPLSFVPEAVPGAYVLVHLGIPVEVLDRATAEEALALRGESP
jgi:hydrogenase maturation factor